MHEDEDDEYRGWKRPGPVPPRGVSAEEGESLDYLCGYFRIFQYERGHRYSTDDVLAAWYATQWAPRVSRAADLGCGIGSVALVCAWRLPGATSDGRGGSRVQTADRTQVQRSSPQRGSPRVL